MGSLSSYFSFFSTPLHFFLHHLLSLQNVYQQSRFLRKLRSRSRDGRASNDWDAPAALHAKPKHHVHRDWCDWHLVGVYITRLVSWWWGSDPEKEKPERDFPSKEEPAPLTEITVDPVDQIHLHVSQTEVLPMGLKVSHARICGHIENYIKATSAFE